jgi:hypothetical protein
MVAKRSVAARVTPVPLCREVPLTDINVISL